MESDSQITTRRLAAPGSKVADGRGRSPNRDGDFGIGHAEFFDSFGPDCLHEPDVTVFRSVLSTAFRNGVPLECLPMTIGERIRFAREHGPLGKVSRKDLAAASGIAYTTLADVENGHSETTTALHRIAKRLQVRVEWLETGRKPMEATADDQGEDWTNVIGVQQAAALGDGAEPDEYAETHKLKFRADSLKRKHLRPDKLAVIYGKGDSMWPTIKNGDAILIDTSDKEPRDEKLFVITYGRDLFAKRLVKLGDRWFIDSDNKTDPKWKRPIPVEEAKGFEIHGRVRWIGSWED